MWQSKLKYTPLFDTLGTKQENMFWVKIVAFNCASTRGDEIFLGCNPSECKKGNNFNDL